MLLVLVLLDRCLRFSLLPPRWRPFVLFERFDAYDGESSALTWFCLVPKEPKRRWLTVVSYRHGVQIQRWMSRTSYSPTYRPRSIDRNANARRWVVSVASVASFASVHGALRHAVLGRRLPLWFHRRVLAVVVLRHLAVAMFLVNGLDTSTS